MHSSTDGSSNGVLSRLKKLDDSWMSNLPRIASSEHKTTDGFKHAHRWIQRVEYRVHRLEHPDAKPMFIDTPLTPQKPDAIHDGEHETETAEPRLPPPAPANVSHRGPGAIATNFMRIRTTLPTSVTLSAEPSATENFQRLQRRHACRCPRRCRSPSW